MNPYAQSSSPSLRFAHDFGLRHWLDALVAGSCSQDDFLQEVQALETEHPHLLWDVLALLDQYFRRRKISKKVFANLKTRLQGASLGFGGESAPLAR